VWVTTDDPIISTAVKDFGVNVIRRPDELGEDTTSTRDVLVHALKTIGVKSDELIVMLYLTYHERNWADIEEAMNFFLTHYQSGLTDSLLCRKELKSHPYLCLQEHGVDGIFGKQIVQHDLYRRQDYPSCFEISHYVAIFKAGALAKLNQNLYCDTTVFYPICDVTDVDFEKNLLDLYGE
jgi:CMP-N-acetylneuraminic acid synthetase